MIRKAVVMIGAERVCKANASTAWTQIEPKFRIMRNPCRHGHRLRVNI